MALLQIDGFDQYSLDEQLMIEGNWAQVSSTVRLTQVAEEVRTGTTALEFPGDFGGLARQARRVLPTLETGGVAGFAARITTNLPTTAEVMRYFSWQDNDNVSQLVLSLTTTGRVVVTNGAPQSSHTHENLSVFPVVVVGAYHSFQFKMTCDDTIGAYEVYIDEVLVVFQDPTTNVDTDPTGAGTVAQYTFGTPNNPTAILPAWSLDDVYILDLNGAFNNDIIGDRQAFLLLLDADQATQDWDVTGAGSGFAAINEIPQDDDTSYIEAQNPGEISEFGLEDIGINISDIAGVQMSQVLRKLDAGVATVQGSLIENAITDVGVDRQITEDYVHWNDVFERDPSGAQWTPITWNATTYKIEKTS